ncbi:esterase [Streptomyces jumonjinensis]|uniref:Esterase n=1 Tax=Streptomyces jumonjinensis TaxID=1945 RepID=A0A646KWK1_STRJU|nr:esterase [Streptomyces jumonjinensis]MQT05386.1 esterase [Streptomyces jumonjinensis]
MTPSTGLFPLRNATLRPMPDGVRGALVREVSPCPGDILRATWHPAATSHRDRLGPGALLLTWTPASSGGMDVTARLGLNTMEVTLATWPGLRGNWSTTVHPTVYEVLALHSALRVARKALATV